MSSQEPLLVYNLFPRYFRSIDDWHAMIPHIAGMNFNSIFINPVHLAGFSGSLYAIKDYYKLNPLFLKPGQDPSDWGPFKEFLSACDKAHLLVLVDLVINHTAIDSDLVKQHPLWYRRNEDGKVANPFAVDPTNSGNVTIWGDLAEINNAGSKKWRELWKYWDTLVAYFQKLGVRGFRCDAAYKVPATLWTMLITNAKKRFPETVFLAETLGCWREQTMALKECGFDYLFNSSKWWNFDAPWCIEQHEMFQEIAPSVAFPESHDTERLASEQPGTLAMQKNRYFLAAAFSKGLLIPQGYEYGAKRKIDVVRGRPEDKDTPQWDMVSWISKVNELKRNSPVMCIEGHWEALSAYDSDILFLAKSTFAPGAKKRSRQQRFVLLINKDWHNPRIIQRSEFPADLENAKTCWFLFDDPLQEKPLGDSIELGESEMVYFKA